MPCRFASALVPSTGPDDPTRRGLLQLAAVMAVWGGAAVAAPATLPQPSGPVVLDITGHGVQGQAGRAATFDLAMLGGLPAHTIETRTPWSESVRRYTGPLLRDVLVAAGLKDHGGRVLRATALNDYRAEIPASDPWRWDVVLAHLLDGRAIPVRDKGPLFVMYPFDRHPDIANPTYFARCIWQLRSIEVR